MFIALVRGGFDSHPVRCPRLFRAAQPLQRLPQVIVGSGITRVGGHESLELADRRFQVSRVPVFHCQTVTREAVAWVPLHHALEDLETGAGHRLCYYTSEMCCPYFHPLEPQSRGAGPEAAALPLGDWWSGVCRAASDSWEPDDATLTFCNLGYASHGCARFPRADGPDAVRFAMRGDDGLLLRIYYAVERDHHPWAHGTLEYSLAGDRVAESPAGGDLRHQAESYARSYLRRREGRPAPFALP